MIINARVSGKDSQYQVIRLRLDTVLVNAKLSGGNRQ